MDIKQLRSFVAVVNQRNFSRAAEKLNISQASVSGHLLQLEKELGVTLINRSTKSMEVTDAGWVVYKYAGQILEMERCVIDVCSTGARRIIRVGASAIPAAYLLPDVLRQYGELFANDLFKVSQCRSKEVASGVREGRFDVGLIGHPVEQEGVKCVPLRRNQLILITPVSERYLGMQQHGASILELLHEPIILRERSRGQCLDGFLDKMGLDERDLQIVARVSDQETVKNMVAGGLGVAVISEIAAKDDIQSRRVLKFDLSRYQDAGYIYLVYPEYLTPKDCAWIFVDFLKEGSKSRDLTLL